MPDRERRQSVAESSATLRARLNEDQKMTLRDLERFGWELRFIRRPPFQDPIPVVIDGDRKSMAVLNADGSLEEGPNLRLRG
ncbi:hypothetical protein ACFPN1_01875 [Lysobacter yangpyeongensis]|jgi:hypothetical protein|uniref:Uncharacterized protein n=1 Tax=Lysobacter yangpyeongensis TaxID=346182 RepID=A0ABW0SID9_9GAMM